MSNVQLALSEICAIALMVGVDQGFNAVTVSEGVQQPYTDETLDFDFGDTKDMVEESRVHWKRAYCSRFAPEHPCVRERKLISLPAGIRSHRDREIRDALVASLMELA
jgi:hypothetical protein